jgi:hypothetical protein
VDTQPKEKPTLAGVGSKVRNACGLFSDTNIIPQAGGIGNLKRSCVHLGDQDRAAIRQIQESLDIPTGALAVRLAIRRLAAHLSDPAALVESGGSHV